MFSLLSLKRIRRGSQIIKQPDLPGDTSGQRPELTAIAEEIIIGID
jgi:hypothetical protein